MQLPLGCPDLIAMHGNVVGDRPLMIKRRLSAGWPRSDPKPSLSFCTWLSVPSITNLNASVKIAIEHKSWKALGRDGKPKRALEGKGDAFVITEKESAKNGKMQRTTIMFANTAVHFDRALPAHSHMHACCFAMQHKLCS
jgi:hypothetical protein